MRTQSCFFVYLFRYILLSAMYIRADYPFSVYGFVNFDNAFDTRQVVADREGHAIFWPERKDLDPNGNDINDKGQLSMIPLNTRVTARMDGPTLSGNVETYVLGEGDFRGTNRDNASLFRLRQAYSDFDWGHTALRVGKAWHPMHIPECSPHLVTYDNGEPPDTQNRTPQIRVTHRFAPNVEESSQELIVMAGSFGVGSRMFGFNEDGNEGIRKSTDFLRWGVAPNVHLQYRQLWDNHVCGIGVDYIRTVPRLETEQGFQDHTSLDSSSVIGYAAFRFARWSVRNKILFTQNATAYDLPNGFAVATRDPKTGRQTYANLRAIGYWIDADFMTDYHIQPGVFAGVHASLGTNEPLVRDSNNHLMLVAQNPDIDLLMKTAVRTRWIHDPIEVGAEIEVSHAQFAEPENAIPGERKFDDFARALQTSNATNARIIANIYYYF